MPIAASLGVAGLGWVASPVLKDLITKSITYLGSDITKGLEDLRIVFLPQFQLTIQAAKNSPHATVLKEWLDRLKIAYYDAEAILHEIEYERLRRKVKSEQNKTWVRISSHPIIKSLSKFTTKINKKVSLLTPQKRKLLERLNILKEVAAEAKTFCELLGVITSEGNHKPTGNTRPTTTGHPSKDEIKVFGRDGDRDDIITFLLEEKESNSSTGHSVVAVTGVGGAGKTTLAQYTYNDDRVNKHFGVKMWLSLSQNKDTLERTKEMIECISGGKCPDLLNLNLLQHMLREMLPESEPVFMVLDDVWYDGTSFEDKKWDDLLAPFASLGERLNIVVTSRSLRFPVTLSPGLRIKLRDLEDNDFLALFRHYAGLEIISSEMNDNLSNIGDQIAAKMNKSPLAAKVMGRRLRQNPDLRSWQNTLQEAVDFSHVMDILLWSYQLMDVQLQRCFLFFGSFTRGTQFTKYNLVQCWVALDFIQPSDDKISAEDVGFEFIDLMLANSMIVECKNEVYGIHDLLHELAYNLSKGDCFRVTDSETLMPPTTVLHVNLAVSNENLEEKLFSISNLRNLRTLFLDIPFIEDVNGTISMISTMFKHLRVLEIGSIGYRTLPETIGDLKNLRYLDVYRSSIKELPDSVSQLYHLQYILLPESVITLPTNLGNLIRLQSIGMYDKSFVHLYTFPPVPYLGRLTSLTSLPQFYVRREKGYELQQLGHLREIGGFLRIVGLENVRDKDEAIAARLMHKPKLRQLWLLWTGSADNIASEDVLEALQPPTNLDLLLIDGHSGSVCPTWLQDCSTLPYLLSIGFDNCNTLKVLPSNFSQFRHCKALTLQNLGALKELPSFPVNLVKLCIIRCHCLILLRENEHQPQVNELHGIDGSGFLPSSNYPWKWVLDIEVKSFEQTGSVENCHEQLQTIKNAIERDDIVPEQWEVVVGRAWQCCHQQRMNFISSGIAIANQLELPVRLCILQLEFCSISNRALSDGLRDMASLQKLALWGIMTITTLPSADVMQTLQSLQDLDIAHCWCLRSLGGLHAIPHLQNFELAGCWCLDMKNNYCGLLPHTLQTVTIKCSVFSENSLHSNFMCLQKVAIYNCQVPDSLSFHHLNSLEALGIFHCSSLRIIKLCPIIGTLSLGELPNLHVQSVLDSWRGVRQLRISSSLMLNSLLSSETFVVPLIIAMEGCQEEVISFVKSVHLKSIKALEFWGCKTKTLPVSLSDFTALTNIAFNDCPEISELPELPASVQLVKITNCLKLRERCQPNGPDWHKIKRIKIKWID